LKAFPVLTGVQRLVILSDNDEPDERGRQAGQDASMECARRWARNARRVEIL